MCAARCRYHGAPAGKQAVEDEANDMHGGFKNENLTALAHE